MRGAVVVGVHGPQAPHQRDPLRGVEREELRLVEKQFLRGHILRNFREPVVEVVAEAVGHGLQPRKHLDVGEFLRRVATARCEGNSGRDARIG